MSDGQALSVPPLIFCRYRDRFHVSCRKHPMNYEFSNKFLLYLRRPHFSIERLHHASHAFLLNLCHNGMNEMGKMSPAISQVQMFCSLSAEKAPTMRCGSWGEIPRKLKLQQIWFLPRWQIGLPRCRVKNRIWILERVRVRRQKSPRIYSYFHVKLMEHVMG